MDLNIDLQLSKLDTKFTVDGIWVDKNNPDNWFRFSMDESFYMDATIEGCGFIICENNKAKWIDSSLLIVNDEMYIKIGDRKVRIIETEEPTILLLQYQDGEKMTYQFKKDAN